LSLSLKVSLAAVLGDAADRLCHCLCCWRGGVFPGKLLLDALVHLPLVVPPVVTGWLLLLAFAPLGPVGRVAE
jgi:molybdate transport system permease protein